MKTFRVHRLLYKLLNFSLEVTSEYHSSGLVNYAVLCNKE